MSELESPIRVCHLVGDLGSGGRKSLLLDLVQATDDAAVEHHIACFRSDDEARREFERVGIGIETFDARSRFDLRVLKRTLDVFRSGGFDVAHAHGPNAQVPGRLLARIARVDHVVSTHHTVRSAHDPMVNRLERLTRRFDSATVAVSAGVKQSFAADDDQWRIIPNGIDVRAFRDRVESAEVEAVEEQWTFDGEGPVFLNVGRYVPDKAQLDLIRAMEDVTGKLPGAHLFLVGGRGTMYDELTAAVRDRGLTDAVTVTGRVPSIPEYYAMADAFVFPSIREGLPIVLLEAMAARIPIVATDIPGVREIVEDGETGLVVPPNTPSALAERMVELADAERRATLADAGFERVASEFDIERTARAYLSLYRELTRPGTAAEYDRESDPGVHS